VNQVKTSLTWATPSPISYGTALSITQLDATANVAGTFMYTPPAGTVLAAGSHTLSVTFTPSDTRDYTSATASVTLMVTTSGKTNPSIEWPTPAPITYGTRLSARQLDATANVAGKFTYSPAAGTLLTAGSQTLSVTFTPSDTSAYNTATATVTLLVNKATPTVVWIPLPIFYGTRLGSSQLDAFSLVPGTFTYTPPAGTLLPAGKHELSAVFTPKDTRDYLTISVNATLEVFKAVPHITWAQPAAITVGTPLGRTQLDATAKIPGTFAYKPLAGTKLPAGKWELTAIFTPVDTTNYQTARADVRLSVK
jgi:hypothetical protein